MDKENILDILRSKGEQNKWLSFQYVKNGLIPFIDWLFVFLEPVLSDHYYLQPNFYLEIDIPAGSFILCSNEMYIDLDRREIKSKISYFDFTNFKIHSLKKGYLRQKEIENTKRLFMILRNTLEFKKFIIKYADTIQQHFDKWMTSRLEFENERLRKLN